jgi:hypothetical protein
MISFDNINFFDRQKQLQLQVDEIASTVLPRQVTSKSLLDLYMKHSMVFTNVPGPQSMFYFLGLCVRNYFNSSFSFCSSQPRYPSVDCRSRTLKPPSEILSLSCLPCLMMGTSFYISLCYCAMIVIMFCVGNVFDFC